MIVYLSTFEVFQWLPISYWLESRFHIVAREEPFVNRIPHLPPPCSRCTSPCTIPPAIPWMPCVPASPWSAWKIPTPQQDAVGCHSLLLRSPVPPVLPTLSRHRQMPLLLVPQVLFYSLSWVTPTRRATPCILIYFCVLQGWHSTDWISKTKTIWVVEEELGASARFF